MQAQARLLQQSFEWDPKAKSKLETKTEAKLKPLNCLKFGANFGRRRTVSKGIYIIFTVPALLI